MKYNCRLHDKNRPIGCGGCEMDVKRNGNVL